ncbi:hypothetical protein ACETAC_07415 [Aceticella autotrophica]|uniref:Uncharacterized protein n=1 Tax=Aceticella autotrophica TaxID=2755338 RepID=A0A975AUL0_9THEO|nr:hypothetical protein [Aceticella autotrophica]QSZ26721.1 hypothetical protein ACETAC_07415 [Aceticella autotrophica]
MIYINTNLEAINEMLKENLPNVTEDISKADTIVMSAITQEDIDNIKKLDKNVFLMISFDLIDYGRSKGFHTFSPGTPIPDVINEIKFFMENT